ncbi:hypothetical protein BCR43DRAFT_546978 [Syncephalastrum racemosum]|uniref:Uncharacterized protein n=1 Tax=Syncephalastrum racemosum TaxID=13706 RepID=A0A1X2HGX2_SYNRA|nr:hypothetical protein BCR43DRAFT_546978 [Syncephalastrum racemosum]
MEGVNSAVTTTHAALVYLSSMRSNQLETAMDSEEIQVIDVFMAATHESELEAMEVCYSVLKTIFRDCLCQFKMHTKRARVQNESSFGEGAVFQRVYNTMGRKVDVLVSIAGVEVSSGEWKAANATQPMIRKQASKNMRTNACIYENLAQLPYDDEADLATLSVMYMDWVGKCILILWSVHARGTYMKSQGYQGEMFAMKKVGETYIPVKVGNMYIPTVAEDFKDFVETLTIMYTWKVSFIEQHVIWVSSLPWIAYRDTWLI